MSVRATLSQAVYLAASLETWPVPCPSCSAFSAPEHLDGPAASIGFVFCWWAALRFSLSRLIRRDKIWAAHALQRGRMFWHVA